MVEVDKKTRGYFTMSELVSMLQETKFHSDQESELLIALQELDHDADGYIKREELAQFMSTMGEHLSSEELKEFMSLAADTSGAG